MYVYHYLNNQIVHESEATISIKDIGLTRGYGIFDYFQVYDGVPLFMEPHLERFTNSCSLMRLDIGKSQDEIAQIIRQLIHTNQVKHAGIKLVVTGGVSPNGFDVSTPSLSIQVLPYLMVPEEIQEQGTSVFTHKFVRALPEVKTTNYSMAIYLSPKVKAHGAIEPLYYSDDSVSECARSNIFGVKDNMLYTPAHNILHGITRNHILEIAAEKSIEVHIRDITLEEFSQMDEVFLTGTAKRVQPIIQIDHTQIGDGHPGPTTRLLQKSFNDQIERIVAMGKKSSTLS